MTKAFYTITTDNPSRPCKRCGKLFIPVRRNSTYCSRECQHHGKTFTTPLRFVGVDGEGVNLTTGEHRYIMLSVGDRTLWRNGEPLSHDDIFPFLYECFLDDPKAVYVGFYLGYDFSHWLATISEREARIMLVDIARRQRKASPVPFPVYVDSTSGIWEVDMLGMKRIKLRPHLCNSRNGICGCGNPATLDRNPNQWLYICDTGSFFQTSFLNVISPAAWPDERPCTDDEFRTIRTGKMSRADKIKPGDTSYYADMAKYNTLENRILGNAMGILNEGFRAAGVRLNRSSFYGPGQAIQKYMNHLVSRGAFLKSEDIGAKIDHDILNTWRKTYYGGRFEIFYHGTIPGLTYEYDIQSAYPHAMRSLPCLCSGTWKTDRVNKYTMEYAQADSDPLTLVHVNVTASQEYVGPLPFRNPHGNILFPKHVMGWYRWKELATAVRAGLVHSFTVDKAIRLVGRCNHESPLVSLAKLFEQRLTVGKKTPHGKAIKLMLNSAYGKMAQSVGSPKYANPIYASMITSECRCMILEAIGTHPNGIQDLIMIATDGIYFKSAHPGMPDIDHNIERLGDWETGIKYDITLMKPGVYWDDKARAAITLNKKANIKSRGISPRALQAHLARIDNEFTQVKDGGALPSLDILVPFSVTSPRLALARDKWNTCANVAYDDIRTETASLEPKRCNMSITNDGLIRSESMHVPVLTETTPYDKSFGFDLVDTYAPDGNPIDVWVGSLQDLRA